MIEKFAVVLHAQVSLASSQLSYYKGQIREFVFQDGGRWSDEATFALDISIGDRRLLVRLRHGRHFQRHVAHRKGPEDGPQHRVDGINRIGYRKICTSALLRIT